ncbi:MAG: hypothetical protein FJ087_13910 [Deltaproteobacteria bacterium]|nr:hypothetical protein [Deltaproteobacteria bacterium]
MNGRIVFRTLLGAASSLLAAPAPAQVLPAVPPPAPVERAVEADEAATVVARVLGAVTRGVRATPTAFEFDVAGFADDRTCPLAGVRGVKCGAFAWQPTTVVVHRAAWVAAVSGHLARNRVVVVDLSSSSAAISRSSLHGVLVFAGPEVGRTPAPAFAWYVSRLGRTLGADLADVDADGALDVVYTYAQDLPGGATVVPRDVWTFAEMKPSRLISAGERLSGVALSLFEGVALAEDSETRAVRGAWRVVSLGAGRPPAVVLDRAVLPGGGWDLRVVADLGSGWREFLAGAGGSLAADAEAVARGDPADCGVAEPPGEALPVHARKTLLDLEAACLASREVEGAGRGPIAAARLAIAAFRAHGAGLHGVATGLVQSASEALLRGGVGTWPAAAALSAMAALRARALRSRVTDPRFGGAQAAGWTDAARLPALLPALRPLLLPLDTVAGALRTVGRRIRPGAPGAVAE